MRMKALSHQHSIQSVTSEADLAAALRGDGKGNFNETEIRKAIRSLKIQDRNRL